MIHRRTEDVPYVKVAMEGVEGTSMQWLFSRLEGAPNFSMRRFIISPGGRIGLHAHPWEHEILILSGRGEAFTPDQRASVGPGEAIYIPSDEPHGYENVSDEDLVFLCMIPNSGDTRPPSDG
ncbi:MAG: cupin domain-containing protein [Candidatus Thermoplasmatota archaeon]|nr:cupin domain-containing protein [Candidatus Thermoplasmatota archaeon]